MRVKVTFYVEASDPEHPTGITEEDCDLIYDALMRVGGEDISFDKEPRGERDA